MSFDHLGELEGGRFVYIGHMVCRMNFAGLSFLMLSLFLWGLFFTYCPRSLNSGHKKV